MPFIKGFLPKNLEAIDRLQAIADWAGSSWRSWLSPGLPGNPIVGSVIAGDDDAPSKSCKTQRRVVSR